MRNRQMLGDRADRIFDKARQRAVVPHQFVCLKGLIAGKKLITAVAAEHDLQMSSGKSGKQIERENRSSSLFALAATAATMPESRPPLTNSPTGTSATNLRLTLRSKNSRNSAAQSSSVRSVA